MPDEITGIGKPIGNASLIWKKMDVITDETQAIF
jgi:hypothetical protein